MRYVEGADGDVTPDYCKDCTAKPDALTPCAGCPSPAILPENLDAVRLYGRAHTLWRTDARGFLVGLDYAGLAALLRMAGVKRGCRGEVFEKLQTIERAVLDVVREKQADGHTH